MNYGGRSYSDTISVTVKGFTLIFEPASKTWDVDAYSASYGKYTNYCLVQKYGHPAWRIDGLDENEEADFEWSIVSGSGIIEGNDLYITQPGETRVKAKVTKNGYSTSAEYSVNLKLHLTTISDYDLYATPKGEVLGTVPVGTYVDLSETKPVIQDNKLYVYGKTTYEGKTGFP